MNIIFGDAIAASADGKYIVLELDTFVVVGQSHSSTAYAIVTQVPLTEMATVDNFKDLHSNLMKEYRKSNWKYCEDAIEHLKGRWQGELDSFYDELYNRVQSLKTQSLPDDWSGIIVKSS
jgi:hypothetical protein